MSHGSSCMLKIIRKTEQTNVSQRKFPRSPWQKLGSIRLSNSQSADFCRALNNNKENQLRSLMTAQ